MTIQEVGKSYQITEKVLRDYEEKGLIKTSKKENGTDDYQETDLQRIANIRFLADAGMNLSEIKNFLRLQENGDSGRKEQIRILRKCRFELLDGIHKKQQCLDRLDYYIREIKNTNSCLKGILKDEI